MTRLLRTASLILLLLPARAFGWGQEGHKTVCSIAWQRLTPAAHTLVTSLLNTQDEKAFVEACLWADQVRTNRPETAGYHFTDIPAGAAGLSMSRDCGDAQKRCATWAIAHFANILTDPKAHEADRRDALRFVIHFVGDIHQPLHVGHPDDRGGNQVYVAWFGNWGTTQRKMNLHSVWDTEILQRTGVKWQEAGHFLNAQIDDDDAHAWQTLDLVQWTNESHQICEDFAYSHVPKDGKLRNAYYGPALGYSTVQLQKAGVRLAYLLNTAAAGPLNITLPGT